MSKTTKWIIGIVVVLVVLQFVMPFVWQLIFPVTNTYGYGMPMMRGYGFGYGMHSPMMGFGFGGGIFMWLLPLGTLFLIVLGIAWLVKQLASKPS
jgi:hypothetical protein